MSIETWIAGAREEVLERAARAAYADFLGRVPTMAAVADPWHELPDSVRAWWIGEAAAVLAAAARGTVKVSRRPGLGVWAATCRRCTWRRYGGLLYAHRHATWHAATHWEWLS